MGRKRHYFMTCAALFFLGIIIARPGSTFYPREEKIECKASKMKSFDCHKKVTEYKLNTQGIRYEYQ